MKPVTTIFVAVGLSILVAFITVKVTTSKKLSHTQKSAYDRVIATNELICGISPWPIYKEIDPLTKEWKGFAIDLYRQAFATLDIKVKFREVIVGTQVQDLNSGQVDAICDDGPYTMSAGKFLEFSKPAYAGVATAYVRINDDRFSKKADMNDKNIIFTGIDGDVSTDLVMRFFPQAKLASMPGTTDASQLFLNVATKKADIAIADPVAFEAFEKHNRGKLKPLFLDKPLAIYKIGISVKKGDFKMLGLANEAIDNAIAFGITEDVLDRADPEHKTLYRVRNIYER